jgi:hypothetical protein
MPRDLTQHVLSELQFLPDFFHTSVDQLAGLLTFHGHLNPLLAPEEQERHGVEGDNDRVVVVADRSLDQELLVLERSGSGDDEETAPQVTGGHDTVRPGSNRYGANFFDHAMAPASKCLQSVELVYYTTLSVIEQVMRTQMKKQTSRSAFSFGARERT